MKPNVRHVYSTHGQYGNLFVFLRALNLIIENNADPWSTMGLMDDLNEYSPTTILPGALIS